MIASGRALLAFVLVAVVGISWAAREVKHQRVEHGEAWVTHDPDSLYHLRRVDRALREGDIAGTDDYLNFPAGSPIPWPPYYTKVTAGLLTPFAPDGEEERRRFVETRTASLPLVFGVLTSLLAALAGHLLAGPAAAWIAGSYHALCSASVAYSKSGNGDHHAWITLLAGLVLVLSTRAIQNGALTRARSGAAWGAAIGVVAGVSLGSWVAALLYVIPMQLVLGWLVIRHSRKTLVGLPLFGLAFHVAALVTLLPAVASSAWNDVNPWMVVNLSWFHGAWLLLGAAVFIPLLFLPPRSATLRNYPAGVAGGLVVLGLFLAVSDVAPARGIREGFEWLGREDDFMSGVWESRGLIGSQSVYSAFDVLGHGLLLLPFAWAAIAWKAFRRERLELLPWAVAVPLLVVEALRQFRFADALALPLAVTLGWGAVQVVRAKPVQRRIRAWARLGGPAAGAVLLLAGVALLQPGSTGSLVRALGGTPSSAAAAERPSSLAMRGMCDWIRANTDASGEYAVLASWFWGHMIEWAADRPTVATNFGSYVGEESFLAPARFFLAEDPGEAERLLQSRRARYVALTTDLTGGLRNMVLSAAPERVSRYMDPDKAEGVDIRTPWFQTMGARLMFDGMVFSHEGLVGPPLDFLRLVHVSPVRDSRYRLRPGGSPYGWVWERVPGAIVEARGEPDDELRFEVRVRFPGLEVSWANVAVAGSDGLARLRVPYATDAANGDGQPRGPARWSFAGKTGEVHVPARAVHERGTLRLF